MLTHLAIKDLVIIQALSLDLRAGSTAMTGETGAGKSILVDALELALGGKADKGVIRHGCKRAEVTASFDISENRAAMAWMQEHELDADDDCILHRILLREGRSRAYINNRPVPLQQLRELGDLLVDIHGQHQHQSLLRPAAQRVLLDAYAGNDKLLSIVAQAYRHWHHCRQELERTRSTASERNSRLDYIQYQLQEVADLDLSLEHIEELDNQHSRLAHAEQLGSELGLLIESLYEADSAIHPQLSTAINRVQGLGALGADTDSCAELLGEAQIMIEEAVALLRDEADNITLNPVLLVDIDNELRKIHDLARKHQLPPEALQDHFAALQTELQQLQQLDTSLADLEQRLQKAEQDYRRNAEKLSRSRRKAAASLADAVCNSMQELGMEAGRFAIMISTAEATASGLDRIEFQVAANPGQPLAALSRVASGGEISRISLAIQVATAGCGEVPTLVYDEVDVGIGGNVATRVGQLLRDLGRKRQVLVVTHLAQVAAQADQHLLVDKQVRSGETRTRVRDLDRKQRIHEIARMLGGTTEDSESLAHAEAMITRSQPCIPT